MTGRKCTIFITGPVCFLMSFLLMSQNESPMALTKAHGLLSVVAQNQTLVGYQLETLYPPEGVDSAYQRSGFFHPINTLKGHQLTRIHPDDHYHHFGMWNPWTRTVFEEDTLDFWNIGSKQATIRFAGIKNTQITRDFVLYQVNHEHVVLKNNQNKVALHELQTVTIHRPKDRYYIMDLQFDYSCATAHAFKILAYRYQGLSFRATEQWHDANSSIITSEGHTRMDADNTIAKWILCQGQLGPDIGGLLMLSHSENFNHPEPIRVWPVGEHQGSVFVNFSPTKTQNWIFEPQKTYTLKYRVIVFDGSITGQQADAFWKAYTLKN